MPHNGESRAKESHADFEFHALADFRNHGLTIRDYV